MSECGQRASFKTFGVAHYWGEGGNESRQQARVSKVRTTLFSYSCAFKPRFGVESHSCLGSLESKLTPRCILLKRQISEIGIRKRQ
jgi:hypothetical protein